MNIRLDRSVKNPLVTPDYLFELPLVAAAVGKRKSGKSTAISTLLRHYHEENLLHRMFLISPNADSPANKELFKDMVLPEDVYKEATAASLDDVMVKLEEEATEWKKYLRAKEVYARMQAYIKKHHCDPEDVPGDLLLEAYALDVIENKPEYKYGDIKWPSFFCVFDDCQNTPIMSVSTKNKLGNLSLRNRHVLGVGMSLVFALQTYSSTNGLPPYIRANATLYMIWRQASEDRRKQIAKELGGDIDSEAFMKVMETACSEDKDFQFLTIDFEAPKHRRFRRCYNEIMETPLKKAAVQTEAAESTGSDTSPPP